MYLFCMSHTKMHSTKRSHTRDYEKKHTCTPLTYDMFSNFYLCKSFDIIGDGAYKSHLVRCRDNNDQWAVNTQRDINHVTENVKYIQLLLHKIQETPSCALAAICKDVITNTTPPTASSCEWGVCYISNQHSKDCVQISRPQMRSNGVTHIHVKYLDFINLMWYVIKIEHVIRSLTRHWIDKLGSEHASLSTGEICRLFESEQKDNIKKHFHAFQGGVRYVRESLLNYINHKDSNPPLALYVDESEDKKKEIK